LTPKKAFAGFTAKRYQIVTNRTIKKVDHMKKLPPRGFSGTMNPQEKKTKRR